MDENRLNRLEAKVDIIRDDIAGINTTLAKQEVNLDKHMKRSDALEAQVAPLKEHLIQLKGVMNFVKLIALLAGIIECIRLFR